MGVFATKKVPPCDGTLELTSTDQKPVAKQTTSDRHSRGSGSGLVGRDPGVAVPAFDRHPAVGLVFGRVVDSAVPDSGSGWTSSAPLLMPRRDNFGTEYW